jgi:hypothetical protein
MLFDAIVPPTDRERMRPVFARRLQYLKNRALHLGKRRQPEDAIDGWLAAMTRASLYLEVAESATALGQIDEAKSSIRHAVSDLVKWNMPFGAALQRAFGSDDQALDAKSDELTRDWKRILGQRDRGEPVEPGKGADPTLAPRGVDTPQQWAYYGLREALSRELDPTDSSRDALVAALLGWQLVPVGRMRFPMDQYLNIINYCWNARLSPGDVGEQETGFVVETLAKQLVALLRALQYASVNRYLWLRLLAPAPWFDLDVALLISAVLAAPGELSQTLEEDLVTAVPSDVSEYAKEYFAVVTELRRAR